MMRFSKYIIPAIAALAIASASAPSLAVPAKPGLIPVAAPDGTMVNIRILGDEFSHCTLSEDGYLLTYTDGFYNFATISAEGRISDSGIRLQPLSRRDAATTAFLKSIDMDSQTRALEMRRDMELAGTEAARRITPRGAGITPGPGLYTSNPFPSEGDQKAVVILVEFVDVRFQTYYDPLQYFTDMLNKPDFNDFGGTGSARDFFEECSGGVFRPQFDVFGPVTLSRSMSYYGGSISTAKDQNPKEMVIEACRLLDDSVDFSQYDRDGDGVIDNVFIFYAGLGENSGGGPNSIWPHASYVTSSRFDRQYFDGVLLDRYACTNEVQADQPDGVGTFIHEFSHVMGLPDLYATSYSKSFTPGQWSSLDAGPYNNQGRTPPLYGAFERYALGWMQPREINGAMNAVLPSIGSNKAYLVQGDTPEEYFLLENRQQTGWDTYIPGHGMLIWHIDFDKDVWWSNKVNNLPAHQRVDIEEADGIRDAGTVAGDAFPGTAAVDSYAGFALWSDKIIDLPLSAISESPDGIITFKVCGGVIDENSPITEVPLMAFDATDITSDGFTANWQTVSQATDYLLWVYTKEAAGTLKATCDFSDPRQLPEGFSSNSAISYGMASYAGEAAPSLKLSAGGDYVEASFDDGIHSISFWHRGNGSGDSDIISITDQNGTELASVPVTAEKGGRTFSLDDLPEGIVKIRLAYIRKSDKGSLAIDDVTVHHGTEYLHIDVDGFNGVPTGDRSNIIVSGLDPETTYYYIVQGTNQSGRSIPSQEIAVTTTAKSGVVDLAGSHVDIIPGHRHIEVSGCAGKQITICGVDGRTIFNSIVATDTAVTVEPGIYIVRCGSAVKKINVR